MSRNSTRARWAALVAVFSSLWACGQTVRADAGDAQRPRADVAIDAVPPDRDVATIDALDAADAPDARDAATDAASDAATDAWTDVREFDVRVDTDIRDSDGGIVVPCIGPTPRPASVGRSCPIDPDSGAPSWQCNEVHFCGGSFRAGDNVGFVDNDGTVSPGARALPYRVGDFYTGVVFSGYIDAYEVTVARYRRWVEAGTPRPPLGTTIAPGLIWDDFAERAFARAGAGRPVIDPNPTDLSHSDGGLSGIATCTWTERPGDNEDRPINCIGSMVATAFCYWDGKQLPTELTWEFVARNRGTTEVPFGRSVNDATVCDLADVGALVAGSTPGTTLCPRRNLPLPVNARPRDVTSNPPGVYGLFGGVREVVFRTVFSPPGLAVRMRLGATGVRSAPVIEGMGAENFGFTGEEWIPYNAGTTYPRGASWYDDRRWFEFSRFSSSRAAPSSPNVDYGFRCGRWERP
jgi:hypothetical protein